jgi:hypothetical protein
MQNGEQIMSDWLDMLHDAHEDTESDTENIFEVAKALKRVGMYDLAEELIDIGTDLKHVASNIKNATSMKVDEDLKSANESSGALLKNIVDGAITIPEKK